jgi:hypothetical protein
MIDIPVCSLFVCQELSNIEERILRSPWWFGNIKCALARMRREELDDEKRNQGTFETICYIS